MANHKNRFCIIGDNQKIVRLLVKNFSAHGNLVETIANIEQALRKIQEARFDVFFDMVIVVWSSRSKEKALMLIEQIRKMSDVPILAVAKSTKTRIADTIEILDNGADDFYGGKPFSFDELAARAENILHRSKDLVFKNTKITARNLQLDLKLRLLRIQGRVVPLTRTEYLVLEYLLLNKNFLLSKGDIEAHVFPLRKKKESHLLNTHMLHLRKKLGTHFPIKTIPHQGFVFAD